jgi:hypothetical protein
MHLKPHLSHAKPSPYTLLSPYTTHPSPNNTLDPKPKTLTLKPNLNVFVFQISTRLDQRIQPPSRLRPQASIYFIALYTHTHAHRQTHTHTHVHACTHYICIHDIHEIPVCAALHTRARTHTHTHTHTHTLGRHAAGRATFWGASASESGGGILL